MSGEPNSSGMIRPIEEVMEEDGKRSGPCEASGKKRKTRARTNVLKSQSMENQCFPDIQFFSYYSDKNDVVLKYRVFLVASLYKGGLGWT